MIIDLSSNNPHPIDYVAVAKSGLVEAVIIKATDGASYTNPFYATDLAGFLDVGIPCLGYHFAEFGSVAAEAQHFLNVAGWRARVLDSETNQNAVWQNGFLSALNLPGNEELDYGSASTLPRSGIRSLLWPASYGRDYGFGDAWQYTDALSVPGIGGVVDASHWVGPSADFDSLFGLIPPPSSNGDLPYDSEALAAMTQNIFYEYVRYRWAAIRSDNMGAYVHAPGAAPVNAQALLWWAYNLSAAQGGYGGNIDLVLAFIIDDATNKSVIRPAFAGSV